MKIKVVGMRSATRSLGMGTPARRTGSAELIKRQEVPYWQERGWTRSGAVYTGNYQTPYGAFPGRIEASDGWFSSYMRFYIDYPPEQVFASPHRACFQPAGGNRFHVHMSTMPADIGSGIMTIERLLTEAIEQH